MARIWRWLAFLTLATGMAHAQGYAGPGTLGDCSTIAVCSDALAETCPAASDRQRVFSARVQSGEGKPATQIWVETAYSRFPKSDINETTGFLPVNMLPRESWRDRIDALATGRETISGTADAVWGRMDTDADPLTLNLYQFNPRGLIRRWNVHCKPGDI